MLMLRAPPSILRGEMMFDATNSAAAHARAFTQRPLSPGYARHQWSSSLLTLLPDITRHLRAMRASRHHDIYADAVRRFDDAAAYAALFTMMMLMRRRYLRRYAAACLIISCLLPLMLYAAMIAFIS